MEDKFSVIYKMDRRLDEARYFIEEFSKTPFLNKHDLDRNWYAFLCTINSVPEILRSYKNKRGVSGKIKSLIQKELNKVNQNELLKYLKACRGCDFHGLDVPLKLGSDREEIIGHARAIVRYASEDGETSEKNIIAPVVRSLDGKHGEIGDKYTISQSLKPVSDQYRNKFHPPANLTPIDAAIRSGNLYYEFIRRCEELLK